MGFAKGLAFFGVVLVGLGLFATIFYQSGLLQKLKNDNSALALKATSKGVLIKQDNKKLAPPTNPNGNTAIAIIRHHRPLENAILDALKEGAFASKF